MSTTMTWGWVSNHNDSSNSMVPAFSLQSVLHWACYLSHLISFSQWFCVRPRFLHLSDEDIEAQGCSRLCHPGTQHVLLTLTPVSESSWEWRFCLLNLFIPQISSVPGTNYLWLIFKTMNHIIYPSNMHNVDSQPKSNHPWNPSQPEKWTGTCSLCWPSTNPHGNYHYHELCDFMFQLFIIVLSPRYPSLWLVHFFPFWPDLNGS